MTAYGLTSGGFSTKPASQIAADIAAAQRASSALGADWDTSGESPEGQLNAVVVAAIAELWEQLGIVYRARDPNGATFAALEAVAALTGTERRAATKGTVTLSLRLSPGTLVSAGSVAAVLGQSDNRWVTTEDAHNTTGSDATISAAAEAQTAGRITANAGTITSIATPKAGWLSVTNAADATPGRSTETDPELRVRREDELQGAATSPVDAIRAALRAVQGVTQVVVIENDTDATVDGIPPHAVEAIVLGGTDAAVGAALWKAKAGGITTHGNTSVSVLDAAGDTKTVRFTRPTDKNIWVEAHINRTSAYAGNAALKNALLTLNDLLLAGSAVLVSDLIVLARAVRGVPNARIRLGTSSGVAADSDIPVGKRQRARLDSARITVVLT